MKKLITKKKIIIGTQLFGSQLTEKESNYLLDRSYDLGYRSLDTAERYPFPENNKTYGRTERIIGNWIKKKNNRSNVKIHSKITGRNFGEIKNISHKRLNSKAIIKSTEKILKRIKSDYIDLLYLHWPDRFTNNFKRIFYNPDFDPKYIKIEDQFEALLKLKKAGKILNIGISNETPWGVMKFSELSKKNNIKLTLQDEYNLLNRSVERSLKEIIIREKIDFNCYSPLSGGLLTGKYFETKKSKQFRFYKYKQYTKNHYSPQKIYLSKRLQKFCKFYQISPKTISFDFLKNQNFIKGIVVGFTSDKQINEINAILKQNIKIKPLNKVVKIIWNESTLYK